LENDGEARVESIVDRDLSAFLVQLSIALHKSAAYPPRHPMVAAASDVAIKTVNQLLCQRPTLALGVARNQLIIDGEGTDPAHPVLRELAQRLYRRQVGGLTFSPGVDQEEFAELLHVLNGESEGGDRAEGFPQWAHLRLHPLAFDQLRLADETDRGEPADEANLQQLWSALVASALGRGQQDAADGPPVEPAALAREIDARAVEQAYARVVTHQLLALARGSRSGKGAGDRPVNRQLADLLISLKPETLRWLLTLGPDRTDREQLALEMSRAMPVSAVIDLVRASSDASQQTISHSLLRIFAKLAAHAQAGGPEVQAAAALRDMVRELLADWALKDPNPAGYGAMLESFARPGKAVRGAARAGTKASEAGESLRLVQMGLELGSTSEPVILAVDTLVEQRETPALLELLGQAPPGDPAGEAVWARLPARDELRRILKQDELDPALLERLLQRLGLEAAEPLLDALAEADSRTTRRRLLTWLVQLGPGVGPMILERLESPHWYVLRNMLVLLGGIDPWPPGFSPAAFLVHPDARVRREALKLALRVPDLRDQGICTGLTDGDDLILRTALAAALDSCPAEAAPLLIDQLESRGHTADLRLQIVRVLGTIRTPATRDCLIRRALARRRWLPGRRLAPKSPEMVAAIGGLATHWPGDPAVLDVLRLAAGSADPEIRAAAGSSGE